MTKSNTIFSRTIKLCQNTQKLMTPLYSINIFQITINYNTLCKNDLIFDKNACISTNLQFSHSTNFLLCGRI